MSGWNHNNADWKEKACVVCGESFIPHSGVHKFCSPQCKGKWQYIIGRSSTENQYKIISGNWEKYFIRLLNHKDRKNLTVLNLLDLLKEQKGLCALSGIELTCNLEKGHIFKTNASIDRIIPGGPYSIDNIQLVCRVLNSWRGDTDLLEFIEICKKVAKFHE